MRFDHRRGPLSERHDVPLHSYPKPGPFKSTHRMPAYAAVMVFAGCLLLLPIHAFCSQAAMKGPPATAHRPVANREPETSSVKLVFLAAIELFQKRISPIEGPRCGFSPSCSVFGRQSVREYGPVRGVMMTADRLMRDSIFLEPGPLDTLLSNGLLFDPPSRNLLNE
jgi:putative component of membrane protein insertase Oxa1/YidC/SpoIIIJ protein YidD